MPTMKGPQRANVRPRDTEGVDTSMQNKPNRLPHPARVILAIALGILLLWMFLVPITGGWHIGYNPATDHVCMSRIVQWCH